MNISIIFFIIAMVFFGIVFLVQIPIFFHIGKKEDYSFSEYFRGGSMIDVMQNIIKDQYGDSKTFSILLIIIRIGLVGFVLFFILYLIVNGGSELPISE